jgi:hypothetical protein
MANNRFTRETKSDAEAGRMLREMIEGLVRAHPLGGTAYARRAISNHQGVFHLIVTIDPMLVKVMEEAVADRYNVKPLEVPDGDTIDVKADPLGLPSGTPEL